MKTAFNNVYEERYPMKFSIVWLCIAIMPLCARSGTTNDSHRDSTSDSRQPSGEFANGTNVITITSKTMDIDMKTFTADFKTDVTVTAPQFTLKADKLIVVSKGTNEVESLQAEGGVWLKTASGDATCQKATYIRALEQITLERDATLRQGNRNMLADRIVFIIRNGQIEGAHAEGNVRGSFPSKDVVPTKRSVNP